MLNKRLVNVVTRTQERKKEKQEMLQYVTNAPEVPL